MAAGRGPQEGEPQVQGSLVPTGQCPSSGPPSRSRGRGPTGTRAPTRSAPADSGAHGSLQGDACRSPDTTSVAEILGLGVRGSEHLVQPKPCCADGGCTGTAGEGARTWWAHTSRGLCASAPFSQQHHKVSAVVVPFTAGPGEAPSSPPSEGSAGGWHGRPGPRASTHAPCRRAARAGWGGVVRLPRGQSRR